jgi:hypothetical protein
MMNDDCDVKCKRKLEERYADDGRKGIIDHVIIRQTQGVESGNGELCQHLPYIDSRTTC